MSEEKSGSAGIVPLQKRSTFPRSISELVTSQLVPGNMARSQALHTNMGVDYIIVFRFPPERMFLTCSSTNDVILTKYHQKR